MDPLAELRDIRLPPDPAWWPPAPGWWVLALLALGVLAVAMWWARRVFLHGRAARAARRELDAIEADYAADGDREQAARRISVLLRRYLLTRFDRAVVAGLNGETWTTFVHRWVGGDAHQVATLANSPYRPGGGDVDALSVLARALIRETTRRRVAPGSPGTTP